MHHRRPNNVLLEIAGFQLLEQWRLPLSHATPACLRLRLGHPIASWLQSEEQPLFDWEDSSSEHNDYINSIVCCGLMMCNLRR